MPGSNGSDYTPPGILDGLGAFELDSNTVRVIANHELTSGAGYSYQLANGATLTGARLSYFDIDKSTRRVVGSGLAYDTVVNAAGNLVDSTNADQLGDGGGISRLCSAQFVAAGTHNFEDNIYFAGEEDSDANGGSGGLEYALDVENGTLYALPAMGRAAWENVTALTTGNADTVALLIGDDRGGAPLYLYVGNKGLDATGAAADDFLSRNGLANGTVYAWKADNGDTNPSQFKGTGESRTGTWVPVTALTSIAEQEANALAQGAFEFSRPEDLATDPSNPTRAVLASTGRSSLFDGADSWGTTYLIDVDFDAAGAPTAGTMTIAYDGDDAGNGQFAGPDFGLRSPDNLEWAADGYIYLQEDRSFGEFGDTSGEEASIWRLDPEDGKLTRVAQMDRSAVPTGQEDIDPDDLGDWESSGIIDVSALFDARPGAMFLFDVQAHSLRGGAVDSEDLVQGGQLAFLIRGDAFGTPITGLPNIPGVDEVPVDALGNALPYDPFGADLESITRAPDGSLWLVDEYRPSIYHFAPDGVLVNRYVPEGTAAQVGAPAGTFGAETLPMEYLVRRRNRGFEAGAFDTNKGIFYAFIQTPLGNDGGGTFDRPTSDASQVIRVLGIDPTTGTPVAEHAYFLQDPELGNNVDKIGDAVFNPAKNTFYVIERDSSRDASGQKFIFEVDLSSATNLLDPEAPQLGAGQTLEQQSLDELAELGITVASKRKVTNLPSLGYLPSDKPEGIAMLPDGGLAVLNDNDFGIDPEVATIGLGLIHFSQSSGLDGSDRDQAVNIRSWPVFGMFMPDAIASYEVGGKTYYVTANEGDARDEDDRIKDLNLDPTAFPNAAHLQEDSQIGRLQASTIDGDVDGDGDFDQLYVYGGRSFAIWDEFGNLVFDSGDQIGRITATITPALFNANDGDPDEFDRRSDNKGAEPEGVTIGVLGNRTLAFIGIERAAGGVMVYDVTNPTAPEFLQYVLNPGDVSPEGLEFISPEQSPTGLPMLAVTSEESGTLTLFKINFSGNNSPVLVNPGDQAVSVAQDSIDIALMASDVDGNPLTFQATAQSAEYYFDQMLSLNFAGDFFENFSGTLNEKWLRADDGIWYVITPEGNFWKWLGGAATNLEFVASLSSATYDDPSLLYAAQPGLAPAVVTLTDNVATIDPATNYVGSFAVKVSVSDGFNLESSTFLVTVLPNRAPALTEIGTQTLETTQDVLELALDATDPDGDLLTYAATVHSAEYVLDQTIGINFTGNLFLDFGGLNEKWLLSDDVQWYYLTPDGGFWQWLGGSPLNARLVTQLSVATYDEPSLLYDAQTGNGPAGAAASVDGSALTIDPAANFVGIFGVEVAVSDGSLTDSELILVRVTEPAPTLVKPGPGLGLAGGYLASRPSADAEGPFSVVDVDQVEIPQPTWSSVSNAEYANFVDELISDVGDRRFDDGHDMDDALSALLELDELL